MDTITNVYDGEPPFTQALQDVIGHGFERALGKYGSPENRDHGLVLKKGVSIVGGFGTLRAYKSKDGQVNLGLVNTWAVRDGSDIPSHGRSVVNVSSDDRGRLGDLSIAVRDFFEENNYTLVASQSTF